MTGFPLLPEPHAALVESLVPLPAAGALPASLLRQREGPSVLLAAARRHRPGAEERALASLWSRWYFAKLIPPVLLCGVLGGRSLPLDLAGTAIVLGEDGMPRAIALPHAGAASGEADPFARFDALIRGHVGAVVESLAAHARLAPRILWNNAAVYADWALRRMAETPEVPRAAARRALALVESPAWPDGSPNPFHAPVRRHEGPAGRQPVRRQCCLLYRLPGEGCCRTCPRLAQRSCRPLNANQKHFQ
jgi:ferric iron reductase protein FhuF